MADDKGWLVVANGSQDTDTGCVSVTRNMETLRGGFEYGERATEPNRTCIGTCGGQPWDTHRIQTPLARLGDTLPGDEQVQKVRRAAATGPWLADHYNWTGPSSIQPECT